MTVRATTTVHLPDHGIIEDGEIREDSDPIVKKYPQFFLDVNEPLYRGVEQATVNPGEKRTTRAHKPKD